LEPSHEGKAAPDQGFAAPLDLLGRYLELLRSGDERGAEQLASHHGDSSEDLRAIRRAWERLGPILERVEAVGLSERLRTRFGAAVDPGISLAGGPGGPGGVRRGPAREYVERFARGGLASRRYLSPREIARGGMGSIRCVWDNDLRRELVMKAMLLPSDRSGGLDTRPPDGRLLSRFLEEAQITSQLDHPGILPVHDIGVDSDGRLFFTMPLVKGEDLGKVIEKARRGEAPWDRTRVLGAIVKALEAVAFAHSRGVVHRDIKPENIMVGRFGETYVMDWGLARVLEQGEVDPRDTRRSTFDAITELRNRGAAAPAPERSISTERSEDDDPDSPHATLDGDVIGTPGYMAPEQARGQRDRVGPRADVYSFGAILYQVLSGHMPYGDPLSKKSGLSLLERILETEPTPLRKLEKDLPDELVAITAKAMSPQPEDRYPSVSELLEDVRAYLEGRVVKAHETGLWAEVTKWMRRNRLATTIIAVSLVLGGSGASLFVWQLKASLVDKNAALEKAQREEQRANEEADAARAANREADVAREAAVRDAAAAQAAKAEAQAKAEEAERERRLALQQSYAANLSAVQASIADNDLSEARRRLALCPPELRGWEFDHLSQRVDMSLRTYSAPSVHRDGVADVSVASDGQIASAGRDGVYTWDGDSGELLESWPVRDALGVDFDRGGGFAIALERSGRLVRVRPGRSDVEVLPVDLGPLADDTRFALAPDGSVLAYARVAGGTATIELVALATGVRTSVRVADDVERVDSLAWFERGRLLALGCRCRDGSDVFNDVVTLDTVTGVPERLGVPLVGSVRDVAFGPMLDTDRRVVAACTSAGEIVAFDLETGELLLYQSSQERALSSVCFGSGIDLVFAGTEAGTLEVWDIAADARRLVLRGHERAIVHIEHDALRRQLVSASADGSLRSWPTSSGDVVQVIDGSATTERAWLRFTPEGRSLVVGTPRGADVWDATSLRLSSTLAGAGLELEGAHTLADGLFVGIARLGASGSNASQYGLQRWSTNTGGAPQRGLGRLPGRPSASALSSLGDLAVAIDAPDATFGPDAQPTVLVYAFGALSTSGASAAVAPPRQLGGLPGPVTAMAYDAEGRRLACAHADGSITVWSARTFAPIATLIAPAESLRRAARGNAGALAQRLVARTTGVAVDAAPRGAGELSPDAAACLCFEPRGDHLVSTGRDGTVRLWNVATRTLVRDLAGHEEEVTTLTFHPTAQRFASGSRDGTLRLWNLELGESLFVLRGHRGAVLDATFDPEGSRLASVDAQGDVRLFETEPQIERYATQLETNEDMDSALPLLVGVLDFLSGGSTDVGSGPRLEKDPVARTAEILGLGSRPAPLHDRAWEIVRETRRSASEYDDAERCARVACMLLPENAVYARTFGIALYRVGEYREAIERLEESSQRHSTGARPEEIAVIGMAHARLGELVEANARLTEVRAMLNDPFWRDDAVGRSFARELERLLEQ
jgi:serine/threonine protein kinase/WD40 repeat protein